MLVAEIERERERDASVDVWRLDPPTELLNAPLMFYGKLATPDLMISMFLMSKTEEFCT